MTTALESPTVQRLPEKQAKLERGTSEAEQKFREALGQVELEFVNAARLRYEAGLLGDLCVKESDFASFVRARLEDFIAYIDGDPAKAARWQGHMALIGASPVLREHAPAVEASRPLPVVA